jgi:hypothetical protein
MAEKTTVTENSAPEGDQRTARKLRTLGIAYRVLLILGIVLFIATAFLAIFTVRITVWYLGIPAAIFLLGIILARMEYNLFRGS